MPYAAGHRTEIKAKIIQSARRLFNRHGFDNVSIAQIMAGAGLTHGGFYSYFKARASCTRRYWGAFSPIQTGRAAGKASKWIWNPRTWARKSFAPICRDSTSRMWRTHVRWWRCRRTSHAVAHIQSARSKPCSKQWSASWNVARSRTADLAVPEPKQLLLCAWEVWSWPAPY